MTKRQQARSQLLHPPGVAPPGTVPPGTPLPPGSLPTGSLPIGGGVPSRPPVAPQLPHSSVFPSAPPAVAPTSGPRLYVMSGARAGETLGLRHGFALGAAPNNDLVIADGFASTHHAQIGMDPQGNCWVSDLGSTNGTFVNGVRVTQKMLDHGVSVRIGSTELRFLAQ
jgi:hypothetical protein